MKNTVILSTLIASILMIAGCCNTPCNTPCNPCNPCAQPAPCHADLKGEG